MMLVATVETRAQTSLNPDISVIPRFRVESSDGGSLPVERVFSRPQFMLEELEIAIQGYLNPFARADVFLAKPGAGEDPLEIEEAYATVLRGLPFDMNLRAGKYLVEFGKINTVHPHVWDFVSRPASIERFLGEEGVNDIGVSASILLPTGDMYSRLNIDLFDGGTLNTLDPLSGDAAGGVGLTDTLAAVTRNGVASRVMMFFPVGESSDLEVGVSGMTGIHDPYRSLRFWYGNLDFKYKWKPDSYTSWTIQGEGLLNRRNVSQVSGGTKRISTWGTYVSADHRFQKVYSVGIRGDWSEAPYAANDRAYGGAVWMGYYPVEETLALRFQLQHMVTETPSGGGTVVNTVAVQVLFSLGPHRAHPF